MDREFIYAFSGLFLVIAAAFAFSIVRQMTNDFATITCDFVYSPPALLGYLSLGWLAACGTIQLNKTKWPPSTIHKMESYVRFFWQITYVAAYGLIVVWAIQIYQVAASLEMSWVVPAFVLSALATLQFANYARTSDVIDDLERIKSQIAELQKTIAALERNRSSADSPYAPSLTTILVHVWKSIGLLFSRLCNRH